MRDGTVEHFPGGQGHRQLGRRNHRRRSRRRRRRSHADVGGDPKWWQFGYSEMLLFFLYNFKTTESCGVETGKMFRSFRLFPRAEQAGASRYRRQLCWHGKKGRGHETSSGGKFTNLTRAAGMIVQVVIISGLCLL